MAAFSFSSVIERGPGDPHYRRAGARRYARMSLLMSGGTAARAGRRAGVRSRHTGTAVRRSRRRSSHSPGAVGAVTPTEFACAERRRHSCPRSEDVRAGVQVGRTCRAGCTVPSRQCLRIGLSEAVAGRSRRCTPRNYAAKLRGNTSSGDGEWLRTPVAYQDSRTGGIN